MADHAAEPDLEQARPRRGRRHESERQRGEDDRERQGREAQPPQRQMMDAHQAPAPRRDRRDDEGGTEAERLQQHVGDGGADAAAEIAWRGTGRMAERRIGRAVAEQGQGGEEGEQHEQEARAFDRAAAQEIARAHRQQARSHGKTGCTGHCDSPQATVSRTAAMRVNAASVVSRS
jgi:hypothetical protein